MASTRKSARKSAQPIDENGYKCNECERVYKRPGDLAKHEMTHSRPFKCTESDCKYHKYGWPSEKERDRHINDKHSLTPSMHKCQYPPCPYESKRESNCKQHMEKAHGWQYVRSKTNGPAGKNPQTGGPPPAPQVAVPSPSLEKEPLKAPEACPEACPDYPPMTAGDWDGTDV